MSMFQTRRFKAVAPHDRNQEAIIWFFVSCLGVRLSENIFCCPDTIANKIKLDPFGE